MRFLFVTLASIGAMAGPALAQNPPQTPSPPPRPVIEPRSYVENFREFEGDAWRNQMTRQATENVSPARADRANRLSAMINAGDCQGAHETAVEEGDRRMARRIAAACGL